MLRALLNFNCQYKREVDQQLLQFQYLIAKIPDNNLKTEALKSLSTKTFHCYGASFYAYLVEKEKQSLFFQFMTSYQTLCDYLDNLVDQTDLISEYRFRQLHQSLIHVFTFEDETCYLYQNEYQDAGYLAVLIRRCQLVLKQIPDYQTLAPHLIEMASLYCDLQVYKHLNPSTREIKLKYFARKFECMYPNLTWYEFSAASGSTLYIFALIANAFSPIKKQLSIDVLHTIYFPGIQQVHIMLDYFVDLAEDEREGELNFFAQYENKTVGLEQLWNCYMKTHQQLLNLKGAQFHAMILDGLMALYLAEGRLQNEDSEIEEALIKQLPLNVKILHANAYIVMKQFRKHQKKQLMAMYQN